MVTDPELTQKVARATYGKVLRFNRFVLQAPVIVALVAEPPNWLSKIGSSISFVFLLISGWFYAGKALSPISKVVSQVDDIGVASLNKRLNEGNQRDEI